MHNRLSTPSDWSSQGKAPTPLYQVKRHSAEIKFRDMTPLQQLLMIRTFVNHFHNTMGLRLNYHKVKEIFEVVNPWTVKGKLSVYGFIPVQQAIISYFHCGLSASLKSILS